MNKWQRFKEGMKNLTPAQQLHGQIIGNIGSIIGLILAWAVMLTKGVWYFSIVMFFAIWITVITYIGNKQKYKEMCKMMDEAKDIEAYSELDAFTKGDD